MLNLKDRIYIDICYINLTGKLKLTSEMKEKLEAVTGDDSRKNSVRSNVSSETGEPRKRSEINLKVGGNVFLLNFHFLQKLSSFFINNIFRILNLALCSSVYILTHQGMEPLVKQHPLMIFLWQLMRKEEILMRKRNCSSNKNWVEVNSKFIFCDDILLIFI